MMLFAKIISFFSNPIIVLLAAPYVLVDKVSSNDLYALKWTMFSYIFMGLVVIFVLVGVLAGFFSDIYISKKEQRPLFFSFVGLIAFFYLISLLLLHGPKVLFVAVLGVFLGLIIIDTLNKWIKASLHLAALSAFVLAGGIVYGAHLLWWLLPLIPIVAWSRVKTKGHTITETALGGALGVVLTIIVYIVSKRFIV